MTGKLYGVGVGPGDPELITLKALRLTKEADILAFPGEKPIESVAYRIMKGAYPEIDSKQMISLPMPMIKEREENKKKLIPTIITGLIATISFITLIMVVAVYTEVIAVPVKILLVVIACVIFGCGLMVAMEGERTIGYYKCRHCNELFVPTFGAYTMGMHMISTRYLKCPKCGTKTWCKKVLAKENRNMM